MARADSDVIGNPRSPSSMRTASANVIHNVMSFGFMGAMQVALFKLTKILPAV